MFVQLGMNRYCIIKELWQLLYLEIFITPLINGRWTCRLRVLGPFRACELRVPGTEKSRTSTRCEVGYIYNSIVADELIMNVFDQSIMGASPATQVFAVIGLLWLSSKIFSFSRLLASIFIIPGISVIITLPKLGISDANGPTSCRSSVGKEHGRS